jgi:hypothetical protein
LTKALDISTIASIGLLALISSDSHDVAFSLKDGETVNAHRLILEAQAPTLYTLASEATGVDDPFPIPYDKGPFKEMMNITYGKQPSPFQSRDELVDLLKVSNYCGTIASKLHAEESL